MVILILFVLQEFCVKKIDRVEVVFMIGVYGFLASVCEMYPFHNRVYKGSGMVALEYNFVTFLY